MSQGSFSPKIRFLGQKVCSVARSTDRLQCLQHGQETWFYRKTTPHYRCFFLAGIKTIGAMMLPLGCNRSQPIPNILADTFFSKNGQVKFWPDNENKIDFTLTARSQQKRTMLVSIPT